MNVDEKKKYQGDLWHWRIKIYLILELWIFPFTRVFFSSQLIKNNFSYQACEIEMKAHIGFSFSPKSNSC